MIDVQKYLGREFNWRSYNCWDFVRDVWMDHCGVDIGKRTPTVLTSANIQAAFLQQWGDVDGVVVQRLEGPIEPCLVLLMRPRIMNHVGVYTQGRLLHLLPRQRVQLQDLDVARIGFTEIRFYT